MTTNIKCAFLALALCFVGAGVATGGLITNGGFETGNFSGWTVANVASGNFYVLSGAVTPESSHATVGPAGGQFYAVSDQQGPGVHALIQSFSVLPGQQVIFSFDMFVNDWDSGPIVNPAGLTIDAGPNQHARVDLLTGTADAFNTGAGVLQNFYLSVDPGVSPHGYIHYSFDISSLVAAGGTFQIRFAEVDNQLYLNMGVDNVSVEAIPEPGSAALCGLGLVALGSLALRRRRR